MSGSNANAWSRGRPLLPPANFRSPPGLRKGRGDNRFDSSGRGNGFTPSNKQATSSSAPSSGNSIPDLSNDPSDIHRERYLHLLLSMVGHVVTITKTNGEIIEGVFHTFCPFEKQREGKNVYVIKGVKLIASSDVAGNTNDAANNNSSSHEPFQEGSTVLLSSSHVLKVHIKSLRLDSLNQPSNSEDMFRTDAEISGQRGGTDRLVAAGSVWTDGSHGGVTAALGGLEDAATNNTTKNNRGGMFQGGAGSWRDKASSANNHANITSSGLSGTIGDWDQFSANEKRFNVKASYDENLYTTALD
jgi:PAB1-binding protein PBP1